MIMADDKKNKEVAVKDAKKAAGKEKKKKESAKNEKPLAKEKPAVSPYDVISFVLMTEKSVQNIEMNNKLVFIVDRKASKDNVKNAVQSAFDKKVDEVNMMRDQKNRKKAFVKFAEEGAAGEIAIRLGII